MAYTIESIATHSIINLKYSLLNNEDKIYKSKEKYQVQNNNIEYFKDHIQKN